jgi:peptide/nickel transport system ATP-binding protein
VTSHLQAASHAATGSPVLSVEDLTVSFHTDEGVTPAVRGVSFTVDAGEVLALVGESGSGKSVSALAVMGLLPSTARVAGRIRLADDDILGADETTLDSIRGRVVSMVFQEPMTALNPTMTIGAQIAESLTNHRVCAPHETGPRVVELLRRVGIPEPERRAKGYPHELSGGQRQRVVIAIALACEPQLIIADEPTTALDVTIQAEILDLLRSLADHSATAFLLITHNMGVVADIADRVAVMYQGEIVEMGARDDVLLRPAADYSRRLLAAVPELPAAEWEMLDDLAVSGSGPADASRVAPPASQAEASRVPPALSFDHVSVEYRRGGTTFRAVDDVSFAIAQGEIVGLVGESGSGKSTLGKAALGLVPVASGEIGLLGSPVRQSLFASRAVRRARGRVGVVFQDPGSSLDPRMTIEQTIAEPLVIHGGTHGRSRKARRDRVHDLLDAVELPRAYTQRFPHELSGGQRQRVGLARALALDPSVLVADEPTSALDVSVQAHVLDALRGLQEAFHFACLFISHDLAVVHSMADRVAVLLDGGLVELGPTDDVLTRPRHPYTQRLLAAVPSPDPHEQVIRRNARRRLHEIAAPATAPDEASPGAATTGPSTAQENTQPDTSAPERKDA